MTEENQFKPGDIVNVLNANYSGKIIFEGKAKIVRKSDVDGRYIVEFTGPDEMCVEYIRFIDPLAQDDDTLQEFIDKLNESIEA